MIYLNLHVQVLDSPEFLGAEPVARAAWLCLLRYCIGQENGGRIENCREWKDRRWQQVVRVTKKEVGIECDLWEWDGDDLVVFSYPSEKETEIRDKRERARENGKAGGRPQKEPTPVSAENQDATNVGFQKKPTLVNSAKAERERERERNEREEEPETGIPPVTLDTAKKNGGQFGATLEIAEAWWLSRDKVGWLHKGQPIVRWQSDLQGFAATWRANEARNPQPKFNQTSDEPKVADWNNPTLPPHIREQRKAAWEAQRQAARNPQVQIPALK